MSSKCSILNDTRNNVWICYGIAWNFIIIFIIIQKYLLAFLMQNARGGPVNLDEDVPPPENGERELPVLLDLFRETLDMVNRRFINEYALAYGKLVRPGEKHTWIGTPSLRTVFMLSMTRDRKMNACVLQVMHTALSSCTQFPSISEG